MPTNVCKGSKLKSKKVESHMTNVAEIRPASPPVVTIPLADIEADHLWNSRQGGWRTEDGGPDESTGVKGLAESILQSGQDTPIDVRFNPNGKGPKYKIITGHRRYEAIKFLADRKDVAPTIRATVHDQISEVQARSLNLRENLARDNIEPVDACFAIGELLRQSPRPKAEEIAKITGKSIPYAHGMINISEKVDKKILNRWRTDLRSRLTVASMVELAKIDKDKQEAALLKLLEEEDSKPKQGDWKKGAQKRAESIGKMLGYIARDYEVNFDSVDWLQAIEDGILFKVKSTANKRDKKSIEKCLLAALGAASVEPRKGEDDDDEEEEEENTK